MVIMKLLKFIYRYKYNIYNKNINIYIYIYIYIYVCMYESHSFMLTKNTKPCIY